MIKIIPNSIINLLLIIPILNLFYSSIYLIALLYFMVAILLIVDFRLNNRRIVMNKIVVLYGLLLIALLIPMFIYTIESFWGNYFSFLVSILIYVLLINSTGGIEEKIISFAKVSSVILCVQLLIKVYFTISNNTDPTMYKYNLQLALGDSNSLGFFLLILFFVLYDTNRNKSAINTSILILLIVSIVALQSRSTMLAFVIVLVLHTIEKDFRRLIMMAVVFFVALLSFQVIYTGSQGKIVEGYYTEVEIPKEAQSSIEAESPNNTIEKQTTYEALYQKLDDISSKRLTLYGKVIHEYMQSPIFGIGLGNVIIDFMGTFGPVRTHNLILDLLTSSGVIGLLLFGMIIFILLRFLWENKENFYVCGMFYGLIAILIQGMLEPNIFSYKADIYLWTLVGTCYLIVNNKNRIKKLQESTNPPF